MLFYRENEMLKKKKSTQNIVWRIKKKVLCKRLLLFIVSKFVGGLRRWFERSRYQKGVGPQKLPISNSYPD